MPQHLEHEAHVQELRAACCNDELVQVQRLLAMALIEQSEASALLDYALDSPDSLRRLLDYGADANEIDLRDVQSRDLLILLLEVGYDVAKNGHTILQCVE